MEAVGMKGKDEMTRKKPGRDTRKGAQKGGRPPRKKGEVFDFEALKWDSIKHSRESMTRLINAFASGSIAENKLRTVIYCARALLAFLESERGLVLDERFKVIEQRLAEIEKAKGAGK
jgi:hypothetical protein